jgi:hypothetical protein
MLIANPVAHMQVYYIQDHTLSCARQVRLDLGMMILL